MGQMLKSPVVIGVAVLAAALLAVLSFSLNMHPMGGLFFAFPAILGMLLFIAFWAAVIAGGLYLAKQLGVFDTLSEASRDKALSLLRQRYANGEISRSEYFQMKQDLEADR